MFGLNSSLLAACATLFAAGTVATIVWVFRVQIRLAQLETAFDGVPVRLRKIERQLLVLTVHFGLSEDDEDSS